jgi:hypothetical protein
LEAVVEAEQLDQLDLRGQQGQQERTAPTEQMGRTVLMVQTVPMEWMVP